jgi:hypothetical protein
VRRQEHAEYERGINIMTMYEITYKHNGMKQPDTVTCCGNGIEEAIKEFENLADEVRSWATRYAITDMRIIHSW